MHYKINLLRAVKKHLNKGGVIAYPTESCYGFGCNPFNYKAIARIIKIKSRVKSKGLILIAAKQQQLSKIIMPLDNHTLELTHKFWPGFYSLILPVQQKSVPKNLIGQHNSVAVRVTQNNHVIQLCNFVNLPLVSTSANHSGFKAIKAYRECVRQFGKKIMVIPGNTDFAKNPSTIINLSNLKVIR